MSEKRRLDLVCDDCGALDTFKDYVEADATGWSWVKDELGKQLESCLCPACVARVRTSGETHQDYLDRTGH